MDDGYYGYDSTYWAYNTPGWQPRCVRCNRRKDGCKKYNSSDLGSFAGEWICQACVTSADTLTPCYEVISR